jgi:hypothetical protein
MPTIYIAYCLPRLPEEITTHLNNSDVADVILVCGSEEEAFCASLNRGINQRGMNPLLQSAKESFVNYHDFSSEWQLSAGAEIIILSLKTPSELREKYTSSLHFVKREKTNNEFVLYPKG